MIIARETKVPTSMRIMSASMQTELGTLFMKHIRKIKINDNLEADETGNKTGKIYLNRLSKNFSTDELKSYFIKFERGSKSRIHIHDSDQIIIGVKGIGQIEIFSKIDDQNTFETQESLELKEGEAVLIPSGTPHWHGAAENHESSQLSFMKNANTFWF